MTGPKKSEFIVLTAVLVLSISLFNKLQTADFNDEQSGTFNSSDITLENLPNGVDGLEMEGSFVKTGSAPCNPEKEVCNK